MSFFGFDPSGHNQAAPGFSQAHDPFAGLSGQQGNGDDAIDFEDTYDGLGDQLEETGDDLNDDTFGGDIATNSGTVGKDFDFFGRTAQVTNAIEEEQMLYSRINQTAKAPPPPAVYAHHQAAPSYNYTQPAPRPARTGYEKYQGQDPSMDLQVDPTLWGVAPKQPTPVAPAQPSPAPAQASGRRILSLEEVEAAMRAEAQARKQAQVNAVAAAHAPVQQNILQQQHIQQPQGGYEPVDFYSRPSRIEQSSAEPQHAYDAAQYHAHGHPVQILQRPRSKNQQTQQAVPNAPSPLAQQHQPAPQQIQPTQILQNPNRSSGDAARMGAPAYPTHPIHQSQGSIGRQAHIITHPSQMAQLSEEEKTAYLEQEARRAKRNHKIYLLSRDNGIMTPHDKNFITRIQLQQLVAATGNPADNVTDEALAEDFYYQVHNQIRGGQRQNPSQPLSNFAQTYLYQTGNRQGGHRRHRGGPENHMQRMEQQVQRAVEAAKNKPKNSQLVIEGSLGKISFSNAKTPKPLLNIKRAESAGDVHRQGTPHKHSAESVFDKKAVLADIEKVYSTLMKLEDHKRMIPPPVTDEGDLELVQQHDEWNLTTHKLTQQLWRELKIHEPIPAGASIHPFIAMLETAKGKKFIPRVFRHVDHEQRTTILTIIVVNLDKLDVVRRGSVTDGDVTLDAKLREDIELFSINVHNTLFMFMGELGLNIITGILGLLCSEVNLDLVARTRVGAGFLTMILSRAEIMIQAEGGREAVRAQDGGAWEHNYANLFNILEPTLPYIFPGTPVSGEDAYVWSLLAALGIGANAEQQQRLVVAVKDRVLGTVEVAKTLPQDLKAQRLTNVNLFMQAIGLDVSLLG
ncbi:DNA topoisomerase 2-associated protein pat1 [Cytospora paraplurivora]|uniref:DNA topoisomerase 2-associated protein pat1 n=1 Tax=Cytospora paraplurivora TaxID=2898453 RepID=A0AAN9YDA8_9PEZI